MERSRGLSSFKKSINSLNRASFLKVLNALDSTRRNITNKLSLINIGNITMLSAVKYSNLFLYKFWMDAEKYQANESVKY
jgi:hypothetical protein